MKILNKKKINSTQLAPNVSTDEVNESPATILARSGYGNGTRIEKICRLSFDDLTGFDRLNFVK